MTPDREGAADEETGLPRLCTWRAVYLLVVVLFILYVGFMVALSKGFA